MKYLNLILLIFVSTALFQSCKGKNEEETLREKIVRGGNCWTLIKFEYREEVTFPYEDETYIYLPCDLDDCYKFNDDGTLHYVGGTVKCDPNEESILDQTAWSLSTDEQSLIIDGDPSKIISITPTSLVIETNDVERYTFK